MSRLAKTVKSEATKGEPRQERIKFATYGNAYGDETRWHFWEAYQWAAAFGAWDILADRKKNPKWVYDQRWATPKVFKAAFKQMVNELLSRLRRALETGDTHYFEKMVTVMKALNSPGAADPLRFFIHSRLFNFASGEQIHFLTANELRIWYFSETGQQVTNETIRVVCRECRAELTPGKSPGRPRKKKTQNSS